MLVFFFLASVSKDAWHMVVVAIYGSRVRINMYMNVYSKLQHTRETLQDKNLHVRTFRMCKNLMWASEREES